MLAVCEDACNGVQSCKWTHRVDNSSALACISNVVSRLGVNKKG